MAEGWISLHRCIQSHWLWEEKPFTYGQAWVDLLLLVNHKDKKVLVDATLVTVPAGSMITSELKLADRWGWGRTRLRNFLKLLEADGMIERKATNKQTTINVVNWEKYQFPQTANKQQTNNKQTTDEQQANTNNNVLININNINNGEEGSAPAPPVEPLKQATESEVEQIMRIWNAQGCTRKINKIPFGGQRWNNMTFCINGDLPGFLKTISELDSQAWFADRARRNDLIAFDWFVNPNNYLKVTEGNYKELRQEGHVETEHERTLRLLREATE